MGNGSEDDSNEAGGKIKGKSFYMQISACSQWHQVRHIPKDGQGWNAEEDNLSGSEEFGEKDENGEWKGAFGIKFDDIDFDTLKVESGDK